MKKVIFVEYPKCGTCQKAAKWLKENNIEVENRHIVEKNPSTEELTSWIEKSKLPIIKFFNTSGMVYKEQNIKDQVKTAPIDELIKLLSSNGMLVKRPIVITDDRVLVGFKEEEWIEKLT
ncbi:MAG: hypothetical protein RL662_1324 [Bacteroidota bacterium]|jgi:arsenate reductase